MEITNPDLKAELQVIKKEVLEATNKNDLEVPYKLLDELSEVQKSLNIIKPNNYNMPVCYLSKNKLKVLNGEKENLEINRDYVYKDKKQIKREIITIQVSLEEHPDYITIPKKFTYKMDIIQNVIGSLVESGAKYITAEQVYRTYKGLNYRSGVREKTIQEVDDIINKLRFINVVIDKSNKFSNGNIKNIWKEEAPILNLSVNYFNGKRFYRVVETPILFAEAQENKHIETVSFELLNIPDLRQNDNTTVLTHYLLTRIKSMRREFEPKGFIKNPKISLNTLFDYLKYDLKFNVSNPRKDKAKYIGIIKTILNHFIFIGEIKNYKEIKNKKSLQSIEIIL